MNDRRVDMPRAEIAREIQNEAEAEAEMGRLAAKAEEDPELDGGPGGVSSTPRKRGLRSWLDRLRVGRR